MTDKDERKKDYFLEALKIVLQDSRTIAGFAALIFSIASIYFLSKQEPAYATFSYVSGVSLSAICLSISLKAADRRLVLGTASILWAAAPMFWSAYFWKISGLNWLFWPFIIITSVLFILGLIVILRSLDLESKNKEAIADSVRVVKSDLDKLKENQSEILQLLKENEIKDKK